MKRGLGTGSLLASVGVLLALAGPAGAFSPVEGQQFSGQIGSVFIACPSSDGGETFNCDNLSSTLSASISWGADSVTAMTTGTASKTSCDNNSPACVYDVSGTNTYTDEGTSTVNFSVPNSFGPANQNPKRGTATANIQDAPLINAAGASGLQSTEGAPAAFALGGFADSNPGGAAGDFTASINWGDGTAPTSGSVVASTGGGFGVTGNHDFTSPGMRTVTVTVDDVGGASTMFTTTIAVSDAPLTARAVSGVTTVEGNSRTLALATFTDADPGGTASDYSATVRWGDGTTTAAAVAAVPSGGFGVSASHAYAEEGAYTATVTIADAGGATATASPTIAVADAPLSARPVGLAGVAGTKISGPVATFTDADPGGALSDYTATIDWGDGSTSTAGTIVASANGGFTVMGSHAYANAGSFHATVTIDDAGGASASAADTIAIASAAKGTVSASLAWNFAFTERFTKVTMLAVNSPSAGVQVVVRCSGRGCPYRTRTLLVQHGALKRVKTKVSLLNLAGPFRNHKLRPGAHITVEILESGLVGKYFRFTIRAGKAPAVTSLCLAPGASKPGVGCQG